MFRKPVKTGAIYLNEPKPHEVNMQLCTGTSGSKLLPNVATIGFFDGVHRGHRFLIEQVCKVAAERGLASSVITFPVHPRK